MPDIDLTPFDDLAADIRKSCAGKTVIYIPNPGNIGDGLIRHATKQFLHDHAIRHVEINVGFSGGRYTLLPHLLSGRCFFLYGGGGAWHPGCDFGYSICRFISRFTRRLLVLPSTFAFAPAGIRGALYSRDRGISRSHAPQSRFCHDMAFYLFSRPRMTGANEARTGGLLQAFRTDNESNRGDALPAGNKDISRLGDHMTNAEIMFDALRAFDRIETDRLHVAIASLLLGKEVILHGGNYPKIRDIHAASMTQLRGARLTFVGAPVPDADVADIEAGALAPAPA